MSNRVRRPVLYLVPVLALALAAAAISGLLWAQQPEPPVQDPAAADAAAETEEEAGTVGSRQQSWSQLGADVGSACACRCTHQTVPDVFEWNYFERSLMTGCNWDGKLCVVGGELGRLSRCTPAPAPARR